MRVAVLGGGRSPEREASLSSAAAVCDGLESAGHTVTSIEIGADGIWRTADAPVTLLPGGGFPDVDVVFPVLHGPNAEDGTIQGLLECLPVPYVGAGILASALCMDKLMFKGLLESSGLPHADYRAISRDRYHADPEEALGSLVPLGLPVFVKPQGLGSSIGVTRVGDGELLPAALEAAFAYGQTALVETAANGIEVECALIGNDEPLVSPPGELVVVASRSGWRDAQAKATRGSVRLVVPARIPERAAELIHALSLRIWQLTRCRGLARIDFFVDGASVLVNEVNTMPGLKPTSIFPLMLAARGLDYQQMLERLLDLALEPRAIAPDRPVSSASIGSS